MVPFWLLVIVSVIAIVIWLTGRNFSLDKNMSESLCRAADGFLRENHACGEIERKGFLPRRNDLNEHNA